MGAQEKFCLRWNDFESNISVAFRELREDKDFFDVTLACDDDQIQAHKVILSACSPFFRQILKRNRHDHPLLYLKGVKYIDLMSVLNFMYHGEVNVAQDELNSFLSIAEDLKVKGLTQNKSNEEPRHKQEIQLPVPQPRPPPERREHTPPPHKRQRPVSVPEPVMHIPAPQPFPQDDDIQEVVPIKSEPVSHAQEEHREDPHQAVVDTRVDNQISMYEENYENYEAYEEGADASYDTSMMSANADANKGKDTNLLKKILCLKVKSSVKIWILITLFLKASAEYYHKREGFYIKSFNNFIFSLNSRPAVLFLCCSDSMFMFCLNLAFLLTKLFTHSAGTASLVISVGCYLICPVSV